MNRRNFIENSGKASIALSLLGLYACKDSKKNAETTTKNPEETAAETEISPFFKLSLAQWSIHKMIMEQGFDPLKFAEKAKGWGFEGLEYVNHLYAEELKKNSNTALAIDNLVKELNQRSADNDIKNLIIMVDGEGNLSIRDKAERTKAVENHHKWVDAAAGLGCHSIRVNLFGEKEADAWKQYSVESLSQLAEYAGKSNINVLVENHGGFSSNAALLAEVMQEVNMNNCGTLPDFGNFCLKRENGEPWGAPCVEEYDKYKGVRELMPFAKAVSAKSYDFDQAGNETVIDYVKMLQIVKDAGYDQYIGVEYEGDRLSEEEGLLATRKLLLNASKQLS
ncbi:sugar phosphate isomerase/epimerase family protein [Sinomicrobium weinanense]|uniref:Sugar phosphate isomerase/epimerase n=1 Tax=Sinomicrobium weinanense TaxID=2842200 RepID=A0A926JNK7_9FLAO|nr:sugar phosphate isomerase/epimerase family protein [Sinomicrobium weinanense]MBC9794506.1 sugar phosphate isomerase/epimerase [Sinomicrobium weinanense]MBU3124413.1 sugar phosphate isomerase/epimerase [Sinomicrobium weinanense]